MKQKITHTRNHLLEISDLSLAATTSLHFPIEEIDMSNPHRAVFKFCRNNKLDNFIDKYWRKEISVEPQEFFDQLRSLKSRLHSG